MAEPTCAECGDACSDSPVADLCKPCLDEFAATEPAQPIDADAMVHLNFGSGRGQWVSIGDLLGDDDG